ncbi:MAG: hypothetical protein K9L62_02080 [Vallitaleaceae bacterium]|nr:hypothetical protein [Vallitaleaceae bacterium]
MTNGLNLTELSPNELTISILRKEIIYVSYDGEPVVLASNGDLKTKDTAKMKFYIEKEN